jgi:glycogen phosphorylase
MEIALRPEIHTYSGGLGVLAGDMARSAADLELPIVFVTFTSRKGYLKQEIGSHKGADTVGEFRVAYLFMGLADL